MTQKALAEKLGYKEQQIQRYEESEYQTISFSRLIDISEAVNLSIRQDVMLGVTEGNVEEVMSNLEKEGLPREFVRSRFGSMDVVGRPSLWLGGLMHQLERVFGWSPENILSSSRAWCWILALRILPDSKWRRIVMKKNYPLTQFMHYLAMLVLDAVPQSPEIEIPKTPEDFYDNVVLNFEVLNFETVLRYIWSLGISVLPLRDSAAFDGAYWRVEGRHVIVLKPSTQSLSRWLFDLLHDYCHVTQHPESDSNQVIRLSPTSDLRREDPDEVEANEFAGDVILAGHGDAIWSAAAEATSGYLPRLKSVLPNIADQFGVDLGAAANYMAHKISLQGDNWWGAAENLQQKGDEAWNTARQVFLENTDFSCLAEPDQNLLAAALAE
ncbi:MAG: ImmA/IrrE family metallo-endopeptidase [Haliea sp.]|nr:ImmA/IrrE family metallo-endopeptidase [Haliea sp.]